MQRVARRLTSSKFVGRTAELAVLEAAVERAAGGQPAAVFVGGESGIGKTRLLAEFEARACARDAHILRGHCLELGGVQIPYAPLVAALRPIARDGADLVADLPAATRNALGELLPELGGTSPGEAADEEHRARQGRLFEALLTLLERLGRDAPVLLLLEDVHWADSSTRDFLTFLVRSAREEPLCLVVTYRSDELHRRHPLRPLLAELERVPGVERIALERFDHGEMVEQLEGILQEQVPADLADRLYRRSQGNALYTEELLAASEDADGWLLPETLRDALLTRVEKLGPAAQAVVRAAAVLDRPISHGLLEALCDLEPGHVMEGAREAVAHQVLVAGSDGMYSFRHALVGEAIHGDLLPGEDTALHRRIAQALEERPDLLGDLPPAAYAAELACHWRSAHELGRSLAASVQAGVLAKRVYAYDEAGRHYERALELWPRVPDAEERAGMDRAEVLRHAAACANARGEESRSVALIREALAELDEAADPRPRRRVLRAARQLPARRRPGRRVLRRLRPRARAAPARAGRPARARARDARPRADAPRRVRRGARGGAARTRGGPRGRRGADRAARAQHARLRQRRPRRRGAGHRDAERGAARAPRPSPRPATACARRSTWPSCSTSPAGPPRRSTSSWPRPRPRSTAPSAPATTPSCACRRSTC